MQNPPQAPQATQAPTVPPAEEVIPGAFFKQSDWTGRVCRETWYGKHQPWRRISAFVMVSTWAWMSSTLFWLHTDFLAGNDIIIGIPLLQVNLSPAEVEHMKETHVMCFRSLCDTIGRVVDVDCVVNDDGTTARVEMGEDQPTQVYFSEECHVAADATFGYRYLDGDATIGSKPIVFMNIQTEELPANATTASASSSSSSSSGNKQKDKKAKGSILTLLPDCSVTVNTNGPIMNEEEMDSMRNKLNIDMKDWEDTIQQHFNGDNSYNKHQAGLDASFAINLLGLPNDAKQPGYRESNILKNLLCPAEMGDSIQEDLLPTMASFYHLVMDGRHMILAAGVSIFSYFAGLGTAVWLMMRLLLPAWVMKRFLSWPDTIDYWHIWRHLLLLCLLSHYRANTAWPLTAIMTVGACYYRDTQAALEWMFLGFLGWGATDIIYPVLDSWLLDENVGLFSTWYRIDVLGIAPFLLQVLVVGEGWWKLVTLYVVGRSYQALRRSLREEQTAKNELEQTQVDMVTTEQHAKVD